MPHYNVLFLCTGNSARSIMAEAILNRMGAPNFTAYSAGRHPSGLVRAEALAQIAAAGIQTIGLRSKSWDEFAVPGAPHMDFVFTVCDNAAQEACPHWPGQPITAHWGVPDPVSVSGSAEEIDRAYKQAFAMLRRRISLMLSLPLTSLHSMSLQNELDRIGREPSSLSVPGPEDQPSLVQAE
jgi:arsenate reductase